MNRWKDLSEIRREYGRLSLSEEEAKYSPIEQFELWFAEGLKTEKADPTAMVLSTVDEEGHPDSRVVLLKNIQAECFIFFTNYESAKALQIRAHPYGALNFYWAEMARQIRIRGPIKPINALESDAYFASRPLASQLSAVISPQSREIKDREVLEQRLNEMISTHQQTVVMRPEFWGGYAVVPHEIEFWQGRDSRLHDRIHYYKDGNNWKHRRLAP